MENKQFSYVDSQGVQHEVQLSASDFEFVQRDATITDQKIQTKPTTFFKDAMRRFRKNKSSVAGAVILGVLISLAIVLPIAMPSDVDHVHTSETLLAPKLFDAGFGWWDGGKSYDNVVLDIDWDAYDVDGTIVGVPTDNDLEFVIGGANGIKYNPLSYTDAINAYAHQGYARLNGAYRSSQADEFLATAADGRSTINFTKDNAFVFTHGENVDEGVWTYENGTLTISTPAKDIVVTGDPLIFTYEYSGDDTITGEYSVPASSIVALLPVAAPELHSWNGVGFDFTTDANDYTITIDRIDATAGDLSNYWNYGAQVGYDLRLEWSDMVGVNDYSYVIAENVTDFDTKTFKLNDHIDAIRAMIDSDPFQSGDYLLDGSINKPHFVLALRNEDKGASVNNAVFQSIVFSSANEEQAEELHNLSMYDANQALSISPRDASGKENKYHWSTLHGNINLFHAKIVQGSYRIDTYAVKYGITNVNVSIEELRDWTSKGWIDADLEMANHFDEYSGDALAQAARDFAASIKVLNETYSPIIIDAEHQCRGTKVENDRYRTVEVYAYVWQWKRLYPGSTSMPRYIFGTDDSGKDMLKYVFAGLRTSLLLGVLTFLVNFSFGLVYGAVAGYFGGWTDILMERFTDILGGVPWIVVMTLMIVLFGHTFGVFAAALCITGWIGTASLTRTQFYRFKSREYILAARTLGASDGRLIFRHILPNAVGTIVTSSVLMIPSVIYSEATLAYLKLGMTGMNSFGVILSDNQAAIQTNPHLILFPSAVMALMMISFNLFGNGLRDAFNPSLKGGE